MKLTKNFNTEEFERSVNATLKGIDNNIPESLMPKAIKIANMLQVIRDTYGKPMYISSGYRCPELNKSVGGVSTSQHSKMEAADINQHSKDENKKLYELIVKLVKDGKIYVGQLINEYDYSWIHISLPRRNEKNNMIFNIK